MDRVTRHIMDLLSSPEYKESAERADELGRKMAGANKFQADAIFAEAETFFSKIRDDLPEIYQILAIREKEIRQIVLRIKTGKRVLLD